MLIHYILAPIFALTVVILCHEFGHFILAKWTGMQVDEFSVGMGPRIAKINGMTRYILLERFLSEASTA